MSIPTTDLDVWVLAGQSNMQGAGPLKRTQAADEDVWCFSSAGNWEPAQEPLHRLWESYAKAHQNLMRPAPGTEGSEISDEEYARRDDENRTHGAGLGIAFANAWRAATGNPTGVIAAAHGGTSLDHWHQNLKSEGTESLYGAMLDRIKRAGGNLKGILWYQGESDTGEGIYATYAERFDAWVQAVRRDTGRPDLPVLVVQLSRLVIPDDAPEAAKAWEAIREAQRTLPERTANTDVAPAIDLDLSDNIHVGTPGLIRLGQRLARQALALQEGKPGGPRLVSAEPTVGYSEAGFIRLTFTGVTGQWNPAQHISGFSIHTRAGAVHPVLRPLNAFRCAGDGTSIVILLNAKIDEDTAVAYGMGLAPYCNAVDDADMGLLTFKPIPVSPL